jgi:hypothetical protein
VVVWKCKDFPWCYFLKAIFHKDLWIRFVKGFSREPKKPLKLKENLE